MDCCERVSVHVDCLSTGRVWVINGFVGCILYFSTGLLFLYLQLRVFVWAASGNAGRFFFGIIGWAALNGLVVWAESRPSIECCF
ncbi:MAG: hypothetical protein U0Z26_14090 [Anaerolineales bacterium]